MSSNEPDQVVMISDFALGKTIGMGTFSKVKLAKHPVSGEQVAIKIIEKDKIESDADQTRLSRELKIMRKVRHPHIAQLYEIIQDPRHIYLVTEYAAKGQLFDHIVGQEKLPEFQAAKFLLQLFSAVQYIHMLGVVHRDLKPENLLLDQRYNIKVIDFGLSNVYSQGEQLKTACGSPCYAAPEMIKNQEYDGLKTDIWSCGVVLYAMTVGYLPFDDPDTRALYDKILEGKFEIPLHISRDLRDLLKIILKINPDQRATIGQIRSHPFLAKSPYSANLHANSLTTEKIGIIVGLSELPFEGEIEQEMQHLGLNTDSLRLSVKSNRHNSLTTTYSLLLLKKLKKSNQTIVNYFHRNNPIINRYLLIEKVKASYDERLSRQIILLENSRARRILNAEAEKVNSNKKLLKELNLNKKHEKHKIVTTPRNQNRSKSASKRKSGNVLSEFNSPDLGIRYHNSNHQKSKQKSSQKHSSSKKQLQRRAFSQGKKYRSKSKKLKKSEKVRAFSHQISKHNSNDVQVLLK